MMIHSLGRSRAALLSLALVAAACGKNAKEEAVAGDAPASTQMAARSITLSADQSARIKTEVVAAGTFSSVIQAAGTVAFNGDESTQVLAPVSGPILSVLVEPGAKVKKGQVLATVTSPDFAEALADFRKAQSAYTNLQNIANLNVQLFKNDAIARRDMEQSQTDAAAAAADRDAELEHLRSVGVDEASITAIKENKAGFTVQATIRAPMDGTVVEKLVNQGQLIAAGDTPCFTITNLSSMWVMADVFENDLGLIATGDAAEIVTGSSTTPMHGQISYIASMVNPDTRATQVRILVNDPRMLLKRDMFAHVSIKSNQTKRGLLVPVSAVLMDEDNLPYVYISTANNTFDRRRVQTGTRTGNRYEMLAGVAAGDRIVVDGALFLQFAESQ